MRFKLKDLIKWLSVGKTAYSVWIFVPLSKDDYVNVISEKFRHYGEKYGASWLTAYSTTDSKTATVTYERTGKRGRPKKIIVGDKVDGHCHNLILSRKAANDIKKSIDKTYKERGFNKRVSRVKCVSDGLHLFNTVEYCIRQADICNSGGDFKFKEYYRAHKFD